MTQSDLLFERIILVANQKAGFGEQGWKLEEQVMAAVQSAVTEGWHWGGDSGGAEMETCWLERDLAVNLMALVVFESISFLPSKTPL